MNSFIDPKLFLFPADETRSTISDNWSTMNAGVSEIDGQEQAAARLNDIVEELPIVEPRGRNELLLPESHSIVIFQRNVSSRNEFLQIFL